MYLVKYVAHCGICSRRKSFDLIKQGVVSVNDTITTDPFVVIAEGDRVAVDGKVVTPDSFIYILLNKPKDYLTAVTDDRGRKTVMELLTPDRGPAEIDKRVYPIGRLDRMSTGILLFTNDGELAQKLSHPSSEVPKLYRVQLHKPLSKQDLSLLLEGFDLPDGFIKADACRYGPTKNKRDVLIELHSGRNRIVRRMFVHCGYEVEKLDRVGYAGLLTSLLPTSLKRGSWRFLTSDEVTMLRALTSKLTLERSD